MQLLILGFALIVKCWASDPCASISEKKYVSYSEAKACLDYFAFDPIIADQTIYTIQKTIEQLYVFNEVAANPPEIEGLVTVPVDIIKDMYRIRNMPWKTDREFQDAIASALGKVHDAHLSYTPYCYRQFIFSNPIRLSSLIRNNEFIITIASVKKSLWSNADDAWVGCRVQKIDDNDALVTLVNYAFNKSSDTKDINGSFNHLLKTKIDLHGWDIGRDDLGYHRYLPIQEYHSYTLQCPKEGTRPNQGIYDPSFTVFIPWVAKIPPGFSDAGEYWDKFCQTANQIPNTAPLSSKNHANKSPSSVKIDTAELKKINQGRTYDKLTPAEREQKKIKQTSHSPFVNFYKLTNTSVGMIDIHTFEIPMEKMGDFVAIFTRGLQEFEKEGIQKIILDLSSNTGGDACIGEFVLNSFFKETPVYVSDIKYSPFLARVIQKAIGKDTTKWKDYKNPHYNGADWFTSYIKHERGGKQVLFSQPISLNCNTFNEVFTKNITLYENKMWKASDMMILSDGRCGSTCAILASRLHLSHGVSTMSVGGIKGNRMQYSSFPGGESDTLSGFLLDLKTLGMENDKDAPYPFPEKAELTWTFRESYRPDEPFGLESSLLEYSVLNADCRLYFTDFNSNNRVVLWHEIAHAFESGSCPLLIKGSSRSSRSYQVVKL
ncbi:hypothetical protein K501DRAFT_265219 [Backusella circina FSU 941]|nr:hypothetical protein K501DRAFT_265219 [Backusella circina FSU 941]